MTGTHAAIALAAYFTLVFVLSVLPTREIRNEWVQLLRIALPSWRFFEELGDVPRLRYRAGAREGELGPWQPLLKPQRRGLRRLIYNPDGNLALAHESVLHQLLADVGEREAGRADELDEVVSYRLVRNLVEGTARAGGQRYFQFELVIVDASLGTEQAALRSAVYPC